MKTLTLTMLLTISVSCTTTPYTPLETGCTTIEFSGDRLVTHACGLEKTELVCSDTRSNTIVPHAGAFDRVDCA